MKRVLLISENAAFEHAWRELLTAHGLEVERHPAALNASTPAFADAAVLLDGASPGMDEEETLAWAGLVRAAGSPVALVMPDNDSLDAEEPFLRELCGGLVLRQHEDRQPIAKALARALDHQRLHRFEYVTVSPLGNGLLVVLGDGVATVLPRPLGQDDDGGGIIDIELSEDAGSAQVVLSTGGRVGIEARRVGSKLRGGDLHNMLGSLLDGDGNGDLDGARLGARLRALRIGAGLTQAEVARRTGIHRPNIARVEAGRHTPSLETILRLATAIGVPTSACLTEPLSS